jgi:hypothetical protein
MSTESSAGSAVVAARGSRRSSAPRWWCRRAGGQTRMPSRSLRSRRRTVRGLVGAKKSTCDRIDAGEVGTPVRKSWPARRRLATDRTYGRGLLAIAFLDQVSSVPEDVVEAPFRQGEIDRSPTVGRVLGEHERRVGTGHSATETSVIASLHGPHDVRGRRRGGRGPSGPGATGLANLLREGYPFPRVH